MACALASLALTRFGIAAPTLLALYLAAVTAPLLVTDAREHRLPNALVLPAYPVSVLVLIAAGRVPEFPLLLAAGALAIFLLLNLCGGLGMGDVKLVVPLAFSLGTLGPATAAVGLALPFLLGGGSALVLLLGGRRGDIPFGPFLLAGYWIAVAAGH